MCIAPMESDGDKACEPITRAEVGCDTETIMAMGSQISVVGICTRVPQSLKSLCILLNFELEFKFLNKIYSKR